ncbi:MAG TPA: Ig-like domain-containing protein [Thermoanaerobaculia bacterium]
MPLESGTHALTARFPGNGTFAAAVSNTLQQNVAKARMTISMVPPPGVWYVGEPRQVEVDINMVGESNLEQRTGGITITYGGRWIAAPFYRGRRLVQIYITEPGTYRVTANYAGDANFDSARAEFTVDVRWKPATVWLKVAPNRSVPFGAPVTLSGYVTPAPQGSVVTFYDGNRVLGAAPIVDFVATLTTTALAVGSHRLRAEYAGGQAVGAGRSPEVTLRVGPPQPKRRVGSR